MGSSGLWHDIRNNPTVLVIAVLLHVVLIVLLSINLISSEVPKPVAQDKPTIKAVVVDASKFDAEQEKKKRAELDAQRQKLEAEQQRKQAEAEARRKAEEKKRQLAEQEKQKLQKQREEKQRQAELEKKQAAEKLRLVEEKKKQQQLEKQRQEAEVKRQAELKRKQEEEARQKKLAAEAEAKRKQEEAEARRKQEEAELRRKLEEEERREEEARQHAERMRMLDVMRLQYVKLIEQKVERNWLRPAMLRNDASCEVIVTQTIMGDVLSVNLNNCAADTAFQQSIERAVWKASPLPPAPNPDVFDREIHFTFRPR